MVPQRVALGFYISPLSGLQKEYLSFVEASSQEALHKAPKVRNIVGVGAGVNRPSLRTVCAVFPRTALQSTQGQPKSMLSAVNNTIAGQCGLKVEQPPPGKASVWP